jgi:hypothetical protein
MARPIKRGLSYFPLDVDLLGNRKIRRLLDKFGCEGMTVYFSVLCEIYAVEGYFIPFSRNLCFDIAYLLHMNEMRIEEILTFCVEIELFDAEMLEKYQALSSEGIQKRYLEVAKRLNRKDTMEGLTFERTQKVSSKKTRVSYEEIGVSCEKSGFYLKETGVYSHENPTKKRKENKIKTTKEEEEEKKPRVIILNSRNEYGTKFEQPTSADEDAQRKAELDRMREAATANQ